MEVSNKRKKPGFLLGDQPEIQSGAQANMRLGSVPNMQGQADAVSEGDFAAVSSPVPSVGLQSLTPYDAGSAAAPDLAKADIIQGTLPNAASAPAQDLRQDHISGRGMESGPFHNREGDAEDTAAPDEPIITKKDIARALDILAKYKQGKSNLESRVVEDELWWELRHWEVLRRNQKTAAMPEPASAWLFNAILNKHADAMDNFPEPIVMPRERSDEESAKVLSSVLPVIMEQNGFEQTYSDNWWEKLKHGTAAYGVFWNSDKENGLGDVDIRQIDLLKLFWEPGVCDIQQSRNLFIVELMDRDLLEKQYPQLCGRLSGSSFDLKQYIYDDTVDLSSKAVVVDWYYKERTSEGRTVLHFVKFAGDELLYASQNDPLLRDRGWYDHGSYPVVLDVMFPEKGTPIGFGYVAICKDPQLYIDRLSSNILENALMTTKKRFFIGSNTNISKDQFLDFTEPFVEVEGSLDDRALKEITTKPLDGIYLAVLNSKIDEIKETAVNRDVNSGGVSGGVTAASAIVALQEAGNKASRDMIAASYRAYIEMNRLVIELIRQFYDEERSFRITRGGAYDFASVSNREIKDQVVGESQSGEPLYRRPVFDLKIRAQKSNPFSRMEQNETAKELYRLGFFAPERAQEAQAAVEMMEFEGIEKVREKIAEGDTLMKTVEKMGEQLEQMSQILGQLSSGGGGASGTPEPSFAQGAMPQATEDIPSAGGATVGARIKKSAQSAQMPIDPVQQARI